MLRPATLPLRPVPARPLRLFSRGPTSRNAAASPPATATTKADVGVAKTAPAITLPKSLPAAECLLLWWASKTLARLLASLEQRLILNLMGPDYHATTRPNGTYALAHKHLTVLVELMQVPVDGGYMNEVCFTNNIAAPIPPRHVVMMHGFAAGLGCFHRNFRQLAELNPSLTVHALDWLGMGGSLNLPIKLSSKYLTPPAVELVPHQNPDDLVIHNRYYHLISGYRLRLKQHQGEKYAKATAQTISDIENYYVDALEQWRQQRQLGKITLMGHLYGGYLALAYAFKYPDSVDLLMLVSPVGVERNPLAVTNPGLREPATSPSATLTPLLNPKLYGFLGRFPIMAPWFVRFWNGNHSFLSIVRALGPLGPYYLAKSLFGRFHRGALRVLEVVDLVRYTYLVYARRLLLEQAITKLLNAAVMAKYPLFDRLAGYTKLPHVHWIYGEFDWMNQEAGKMILEEITKHGGDSSFHVVRKAGHNLFLDNPTGFAKTVQLVLDKQ